MIISSRRNQGSGPKGSGVRGRGSAFSAFCLLLTAFCLLVAAPSNVLAQTKSFHMDSYDSNITVNQDGSLDVEEILVYVYDVGDFHRGTRIIPLDRVTDINNISVTEERDGQTIAYRETSYDPDSSTRGVPGTFGTLREGNNLNIRWVYDYVSNTSKTFHLTYHAVGAVRVYDNRDEVDWYAIPQDWGSTINRSRVQVNLPPGTDVSNLNTTSSIPSAEVRKEGSTLVWTAGGDLSNGLEIGVQLPKGILQATKQPWQSGIDQQEQYKTSVEPLVNIGLLLLGVILLVGGVLWSIRSWYTHGRDKPVKLFSDYLTDPPSDLPPGLVGTLLDESADVRDVIATVVDQGRKGNLTIQETDRGGLFSSKDFEYTKTGEKVNYRFEEMTLNSIFKHGNPVKLSELKNTFYNDLPPIYDEMYRSLVALKYFPENPKSVRTRNVFVGILFFVLAGLGIFIAATFAGTVSPFLFIIPFALGAIGLVRLMTAHIMPRKTDFGSEEAAKWRAFGRYLQEMSRYTNVQAAADKFQQYLPYAVALGQESSLIQQFNSVPAAMPRWYSPYGYSPIIYPYPVGSPAQQGGEGAGAPGAMPQINPAEAMQGMSDSLAGAMQGMSNSFTSMVNSASSVLTSAPSSSGSGGGWGGGGGGFGGGGGGGGGGGAD